MFMNKDQREIQRKLRILRYADEIGHVAILALVAPTFTAGGKPTLNVVKLGWSMPLRYPSSMPTGRRPSVRKRFSIFAANTTSAQCGSFGI
jgi:hypothetical protein